MPEVPVWVTHRYCNSCSALLSTVSPPVYIEHVLGLINHEVNLHLSFIYLMKHLTSISVQISHLSRATELEGTMPPHWSECNQELKVSVMWDGMRQIKNTNKRTFWQGMWWNTSQNLDLSWCLVILSCKSPDGILNSPWWGARLYLVTGQFTKLVFPNFISLPGFQQYFTDLLLVITMNTIWSYYYMVYTRWKRNQYEHVWNRALNIEH